MSSVSKSKNPKKTSKTNEAAVSNYNSKKSTRVIQVSEPFPLSADQLETNSVLSIQRLLNPNFDPVSSALQLQCKIQNPKTMDQPSSPLSIQNQPVKQSLARRRSTSSQRRQGSVEKRNQRERARVHVVNQAFHALRSTLPSLKSANKRVSKLRILKAAINYIYVLNDQMDGIVTQHHIDSPISSNASSAASPTNLTTQHLIQNDTALCPISLNTQNIPISPALTSQQAANFLNLPYMNYQDVASYIYSANFNP